MFQNQATGMVEVIVDKILLLNSVDTMIPFQIRKFNKVKIIVQISVKLFQIKLSTMH